MELPAGHSVSLWLWDEQRNEKRIHTSSDRPREFMQILFYFLIFTFVLILLFETISCLWNIIIKFVLQ